MLRVALLSLWFALAVSFAVSAGMIGMPITSILYEITRVTLLIALGIGAVVLVRTLATTDWRGQDSGESSV